MLICHRKLVDMYIVFSIFLTVNMNLLLLQDALWRCWCQAILELCSKETLLPMCGALDLPGRMFGLDWEAGGRNKGWIEIDFFY